MPPTTTRENAETLQKIQPTLEMISNNLMRLTDAHVRSVELMEMQTTALSIFVKRRENERARKDTQGDVVGGGAVP